MDSNQIAKALVLMGAGALAYHFYINKDSEQKTNPDEIDSETKMALIQKALENRERALAAPRRNTLIVEEDDIYDDEL